MSLSLSCLTTLKKWGSGKEDLCGKLLNRVPYETKTAQEQVTSVHWEHQYFCLDICCGPV